MSIFSIFKNTPDNIHSVNATEFKTVIADKEVQLIDVRTAQEYAQGTIQDAQLINIYSGDFQKKIDNLDKARPVAVFCHSGARSLQAALFLKQKGFDKIYNLKGGIITWR